MPNAPVSFKDLIDLNQISQTCNGIAVQFVQDFRNPDSYSYPEATERLRQAAKDLDRLRDAINHWDRATNVGQVLDYVAQAIGLSQQILYVGGRSILTAHEAAREIGKQVVSAGPLCDPAGDPRDALKALANRLEGLNVSDLSARLEGEFWEASELFEIDEEDEARRLHGADSAGSKTDNGKKSSAIVPENPDVAKLAKEIKRRLLQGDRKIAIALDFAGGDEKRAKSLLRQLRRFPHLLG